MRAAAGVALAVLLCASAAPAGPDCRLAGRRLRMPPLEEVPPPEARIVPWCDYVGLVRSGAVTPLTRRNIRQQRLRQLEGDKANLEFIQAYLAAHPEAAPMAALLEAVPQPAANLQPTADGNWRLTLPSGDDVVTFGRYDRLEGLADAIRLGEDRERTLGLYAELYGQLPPPFLDPASGPGGVLPTPTSLETSPLPAIRDALGTLGGLSPLLDSFMPAGPPISTLRCDFEVGTSPVFGDHRYFNPHGSPWLVRDGFGIFASINFPNRPYLTCVRSQGRRGTCHTFASVSGLEMMVARATAAHMNFSEQDLMEHYKLLWNPDSRGWYADGGSSATVIQSAIANGYSIPYEADWPYNPSLDRVILQPSGFMQKSCKPPYPGHEPCSDTSAQAPLVCGLDPDNGNWTCSLEDAGKPGSPHGIGAGGHFWWGFPFEELSVEVLRTHVALQHGVTIALLLTPNFNNLAFRRLEGGRFVDTPYGGYLQYSPQDLQTTTGDHVVHVVGFVSNEELAQAIPGAPPAPRKGYFIIKNSWGPWWGDAGYGYLPWDYVAQRTYRAAYISAAQ